MEEKYLTVTEAAEYLGLSEHTLNKWRCEPVQNLRFSKFGKYVRYKKSVLDRYLKTKNLLTPEVEIYPKEQK